MKKLLNDVFCIKRIQPYLPVSKYHSTVIFHFLLGYTTKQNTESMDKNIYIYISLYIYHDHKL